MKYCPQCQKSFADHNDVCPVDKTRLIDFDVNSLIGQTIDSKYQIQSLLGVGGMGAVFRARHTFIGNDVAIKMINPKLASNNETAERFLREARAAAAIDHTNAVKVTDFGRAGETLYLVMEFVPGYNLTNLIRKKGHLSASTTANIMTQICAALDDAHAKHIVHRDLKPDNIMIKVDKGKNVVKVFDFGIAKMMTGNTEDNSITRAGTIVGTVNYMSPEQCRGDEIIDFRADIYSLGVVAYEMLTGKLPFTAPSPTALAVKHIVEPPPPLRRIVATISESVEKVVMKALSKDPNQRHNSAGEFAAQLASAAYSEGLDEYDEEFPPLSGPSTGDYNRPKTGIVDRANLTQIGTGEAVVSNVSRRQWLYIVGGVVAVGLGVGGYFGLKKATSSSKPKDEKAPAPAGSQTVDPNEPNMVLISGGWFKMGSADGEAAEQPVHEVWVDSFYLDITPITNAEFEKFINITNYKTDAEKSDSEQDWRHYYTTARRDYPVVCVSWNDANEYAKWAKKRLPTEAEWEYAARGGLIGKKYPWGDEPPQGRANFDHADVSGEASTDPDKLPLTPVKSFSDNGYGLYGMAGNVYQWCNDYYDKLYYSKSAVRNPTGPDKGEARTMRGGSWYTPEPTLRVSARLSDSQEGVQFNYGFRCAKNKKA